MIKCVSVRRLPTRTFFSLPKLPKPDFGSKRKQYAETRVVGYSMDEMFGVVSDVSRYSTFVPWCNSSVITRRGQSDFHASLSIGFPPIQESYVSHVQLSKPQRVTATCTEGKLFNLLLTRWQFSPGLPNKPRTCTIDFSVEFEFRYLLHSQISHVFFDEVVRKQVMAFLKEANKRYGQASIPHGKPVVKTQRS